VKAAHAAPRGAHYIHLVRSEKSLHNDMLARRTISGPNHSVGKWRKVRFTEAGISP
jgi:hypothetical protein